MAQLLGMNDDPTLKLLNYGFDLYAGRNSSINAAYEAFYQKDVLKEEGAKTIATSDIRSSAGAAIHLLAKQFHRDSLPKSIYDTAEQVKRDKAERAVKGWWRQVDFGDRGYLRQGRSWQQHELAAWQILTGWAVQYTALVPGPDGTPHPIADLLDPSATYPFWNGPYKELSDLLYMYSVTGRRLKAMAATNDFTIDEDIPDDASMIILDSWEERYNREDPSQPDVLNSVFYSTADNMGYGGAGGSNRASYPRITGGWKKIRDFTNFSPNSAGRNNGFARLPFIVLRADDTPIAGSYETNLTNRFAKTAGGMVGPMITEWKALNELMSTFWQDVQEAMIDTASIAVSSPGAQDSYTEEERGKPKQLDIDTRIDRPLARQPMMSPITVLMDYMKQRLSRLSFFDESFGGMSRSLSGVALKNAQESSRTQIEPYKRGAEFLYAETGRLWLDEFKRRFAGSTRGNIRIQGRDVRLGFFDEEFDPGDMPNSTFFESELELAMPEDDMMKANIFRALNPAAKMSLPWLRERVMKVEALKLESEQLAADNIAQSPVRIQMEVANQLFDLARAAEEGGDKQRATVYALGAQQLMMSLMPQQGKGTPEGPSQGPPEAGGNFSNAGGGMPEMSPENQPSMPGEVAAPAGGGPLEQAARNVGGV